MAKGDDALARKKNKLTRKKMSRKNNSATVSARIASIIAAKKRRKSGKRSMCQGMCFSLPTPEDPFNEMQGKVAITKKKTKKKKVNNKRPSPMAIDRIEQKGSHKKPIGSKKFLTSCLNQIEDLFRLDGTYNDEEHRSSLHSSTWGIEFWKRFSSGNDIVETSGSSSTLEQIAWIVSAAADAMATRDEEVQDESFGNSPFLLFLVPSQSNASKVRSVCKALKHNGIHTVSLHQGASIDHQISGLKSLEPEYIVATPERLWEIVNMKGVDISRVSLLVVDELGSLCTSGYLDAVKSIKQAISSKHQTIVFNNRYSSSDILAVQSLVGRSVNRLSLSDSVASQGACIIQTVHICVSEAEKLQKFTEILESTSSTRVHIVTKEESFRKFKALPKLNSDSKISDIKKKKPLASFIDIEQLDTKVMRDFETVLLPDSFPSLETYVQILTSMARDSVCGVLHCFLTEKEAASCLARALVNLLEDCGQLVPMVMYDAISD